MKSINSEGDYMVELAGLTIVFWIFIILLNVTLFFKVWGMTNNIAKIKDMLQEWLDIEHPVVEDEKREVKNTSVKQRP